MYLLVAYNIVTKFIRILERQSRKKKILKMEHHFSWKSKATFRYAAAVLKMEIAHFVCRCCRGTALTA